MSGYITRISALLSLAGVLSACSGGMSADEVEEHASRYTSAWNSGDPSAVAGFFSPDGSLTINDGEPAVGRQAITEVASGFMNAFPDMQLEMTGLETTDTGTEYHWRFTGTHSVTGAEVDLSGYEAWTFGDDKLVAQSLGNFDAADYERQVNTPRPLTPDSTDADIVAHMLQHERNQTKTSALTENFPEMSRERAYAIQRARLEATASDEDPHVGWKLGWTRLTEPGAELDPIVGHYLRSRVSRASEPFSTRWFTEGTAFAEPEIVFYLNRDLPGPTVTREEVIEAIESVGIAMEFVHWRAEEPNTREHAIVDNGIAVGVILGEEQFDVANLDFSQIEGTVTVNSSDSRVGSTTTIMGVDPIEGLLWAANELPKYGMHLQAGQFVVSGTVCEPLPVSAGDSARIAFTGMGSLGATFVE